ncbi:MAG: hypothetical protein LBT17_00215 [Mycoplasmataceae bacterium]|jgi:uncharacterized membrane protein|nr:hypothetical protein [Mycoplasmataceae bacterium]
MNKKTDEYIKLLAINQSNHQRCIRNAISCACWIFLATIIAFLIFVIVYFTVPYIPIDPQFNGALIYVLVVGIADIVWYLIFFIYEIYKIIRFNKAADRRASELKETVALKNDNGK